MSISTRLVFIAKLGKSVGMNTNNIICICMRNQDSRKGIGIDARANIRATSSFGINIRTSANTRIIFALLLSLGFAI